LYDGVVKVPSSKIDIAVGKPLRGYARRRRFAHVVELPWQGRHPEMLTIAMWCSQNCKEDWSLGFPGEGRLAFCFRDVTDAIFFKLRFYET
jgi:hypothetical protein